MILKESEKITILFLSWRDIKSPKMGGAEIFTHEMMRNSDLSKFRIIHISPMFYGAVDSEVIDGITYLRMGNILSVILKSRNFYIFNKDKINYVIDQCNTHRFFTKFWVIRDKRIFFIHQLTREIWNYHLFFPFNLFGSLLENFMLKLNKNDKTLTVSESTKKDLLLIGFDEKNIKIIPEGINFNVWPEIKFYNKEKRTTFIYVGRFAKYKGIDSCIQAFCEYKKYFKEAKLWILGKKDEKYIIKNLIPICKKNNISYGDFNDDNDIIFFNFVTDEKKLELMSRAYALLMPSIREGWGLIITEAAAVGTPSIVYNSPGIIDAVNFGESGYIATKNNYIGLFEAMKDLSCNKEKYINIRKAAYNFSSCFKWTRTGKEFSEFILNISNNRKHCFE
ncbi:MAG: glycosyltransferase family 4 protein [Treponema sp.]|nr:glycosyltransferase family 4 protein [Treponema sp.]MCL2271284.1 glycosyltransferase family 4 protein [Treponema sp.]